MKRSSCCKVDCSLCENFKAGESLMVNFNEEELRELDLNKKIFKVKKNQNLFVEGGRAFGLYCVHKGKLKISKLGNLGREQIVRLAKEGDIVGYRAFIEGDKYYATATALEDSEVCFFPQSEIFKRIEANPTFLMAFLRQFSEDLKNAESKITQLTQNYVNQRVAESLLWIKNTFGYMPDSNVINTTLTRSELAGIAGTTTESAIRVLSEFQKEKIIKLESKKIAILNEQRLKTIAELPY